MENITKKYGQRRVLSNISLEFNKDEIIALLGPNGAGKTTILKCILGLIHFKGKILVDNLNVTKKGNEVRKWITYIPQNFIMYDNLSVIRNIRFFADLNNISKEDLKSSLSENNLTQYLDKRAGDLSHGLKQKIAIVIALLSDKPILLFDEPTSNLDLQGVLDFKEIIKKQSNKGKTIIISTHLLSDANELANRVIVLRKGKLLFDGKLDDFFIKNRATTRILITLYSELKKESIDYLKENLLKAGAEQVSFKQKSISVYTSSSKKISVLNTIEDSGFTVKDFRVFEAGIEEAFLEIAGN